MFERGQWAFRVLAFVASTLAPSMASAQQPIGHPAPVELRTMPKRFMADEWQMWTSPFRSTPQRAHTVKKYVIPFVLISAALIATDRQTGRLLPNTTDQTIWSGRVSQLGASYSLAGMSLGTYVVGRLAGNDHAKEAGLLSLAALGHTQIVVQAFKQATNRQRPLDQDGRGSFWEGGNSFPSGHAAGSFAVATIFAYEYRDRPVIPIVAYSLATAISASRLSARRHWISDIAVGGSLGFLIGRFTYKRNHNPNLPGSPVGRAARLIPQVGIGDSGIRLSWRLLGDR